jgi:hypothetical protein
VVGVGVFVVFDVVVFVGIVAVASVRFVVAVVVVVFVRVVVFLDLSGVVVAVDLPVSKLPEKSLHSQLSTFCFEVSFSLLLAAF